MYREHAGLIHDHHDYDPYTLDVERARRLRALDGKHIVVCDSTKKKHAIIYYQDRSVSSGGFWTQYLSNALSFASREDAETVAASFRYNNPRVMRVHMRRDGSVYTLPVHL